MYNRLKSDVELNGLLYNRQYGFRENMSTQHAILDIVNLIQSNNDNNCSLVVFSLTSKRLLILWIIQFF